MEPQLLSTWNQIAPRVYIRHVYCFPFLRNADLDSLRDHLTSALDQLRKHFPELAGSISLASSPFGHLSVNLEEGAVIPLKIFDQRTSFGWTYSELEAQGFPAKAFVSHSFDLPCQLVQGQKGVPVFEIHARVIDGGLLLCMYSHHSISDGAGAGNHMKVLAELTIDPTRAAGVKLPTDFHVDLLPQQLVTDRLDNVIPTEFHELLALCGEYTLLKSPDGPTQFKTFPKGVPLNLVQKTGRIFTVHEKQIRNLKERLVEVTGSKATRQTPSTFACLAAIAWAHITTARISSPKSLLENPPIIPRHCNLAIPTNWRRRVFADVMRSSAGNTIALTTAVIDTSTLMAACNGKSDAAVTFISAIVCAIEAAVSGVDENFVAVRTALIRAAPDPRLIGLNADVRDPRDCCINTWRHFGADTRWGIPGLVGNTGDGVAPSTIRRAQTEWNMGAGLILPGRDDSIFELLVTLDVDAMDMLCRNPSWMSWVEDVIE